MQRQHALEIAREECGADSACVQRVADEWFERWAENRAMLGMAAGIVTGLKGALAGRGIRADTGWHAP